jgi:hypothetical protein
MTIENFVEKHRAYFGTAIEDKAAAIS